MADKKKPKSLAEAERDALARLKDAPDETIEDVGAPLAAASTQPPAQPPPSQPQPPPPADDSVDTITEEDLHAPFAAHAEGEPPAQEGDTGTAPPPQTAAQAQPDQPAAPPPAPTAEGQPDLFADAVEVELEDDDDKKYKVRVPKAYADRVRSGFERRSTMDRKLGQFGKSRGLLEPLANTGQLDQIAPLIDFFSRDQEAANAAVEIYARRQRGLPVKLTDVTPSGDQAQAPQLQPVQLPDLSDVDEYTRETVLAVAKPLVDAVNESRQYISKLEQDRADSQRTTQAQTETQRQMLALASQVRFELNRRWPNTFKENGSDEYARVHDYAMRNGYLQSLGANAAAYITAANDMISQGMLGEQPAAAPGPNPAAESAAARAIQEAEQAAAATRRNVGASTIPSGGAQQAARPAPKRPPRFLKTSSGKTRPLTPQEIAKWYERNGGVPS